MRSIGDIREDESASDASLIEAARLAEAALRELDARAGETPLPFGKHRGQVYRVILNVDAGYTAWVKDQTTAWGGLKDFRTYLLQRDELLLPVAQLARQRSERERAAADDRAAARAKERTALKALRRSTTGAHLLQQLFDDHELAASDILPRLSFGSMRALACTSKAIRSTLVQNASWVAALAQSAFTEAKALSSSHPTRHLLSRQLRGCLRLPKNVRIDGLSPERVVLMHKCTMDGTFASIVKSTEDVRKATLNIRRKRAVLKSVYETLWISCSLDTNNELQAAVEGLNKAAIRFSQATSATIEQLGGRFELIVVVPTERGCGAEAVSSWKKFAESW